MSACLLVLNDSPWFMKDVLKKLNLDAYWVNLRYI